MRANLEKHFWFYSGSWWTPRAMIWDCSIKWSCSCTRNAHSSVWLHMFFQKLASWRFGALRKSRNRIFICSRTPRYDSCFRGTWMRRYIVFNVFGSAHFPTASVQSLDSRKTITLRGGLANYEGASVVRTHGDPMKCCKDKSYIPNPGRTVKCDEFLDCWLWTL